MKSLTVTAFIRDSFENYQKSACGITLYIGRQRVKKSEALKKINEADLLTIDGFGLGTLTAQEQSLVFEITKSRADNLSMIIVS